MHGRSGLLAGATSLLLLVGVGVGGAPAQAAPAAPVPAVALPAQVDSPARYEGQSTCDPAAKPGATALGSVLVSTYGPATVYIPRACGGSISEHKEGRAVDWMRSVRVPAQKEMADAFVAWLLAPAADGTPHEMARRMGIMYIIWDNRMIRMYDPGRGWTEYSGCLGESRAGTSMDTTCHRDHVHLSMSWDGAAGLTSWWSGVAQIRPSCPAMGTIATPGSGDVQVVADPAVVPGLVPVPATSVLDTAAGAGAGLVGSCRLQGGRSLFPSAAVPGLVPAGARAVALSLTVSSNTASRLSVWSSGGTRPVGQVSVPMGTSTWTVLVPPASDGSVGISTSSGAADVSARVVGHVPGDPGTVVRTDTSGQGGGDSTGGASSGGASSGGATEPPVEVARPSKPRAVTAKSARRAVTTRWKAPTSAGGAPVTGYRVQALTSSRKGASVAGTCRAAPGARSCTIKGLKKGRKYWMSVSVTNAGGTSWAPRRAVRVR